MLKKLKNERGAASVIAIIILLMLAYYIRGTNYSAGILVDMTRNFEVENQLQLAAESVLNKKLEQFHLGTAIKKESSLFSTESGTLDDGIMYTVKVRQLDGKVYQGSTPKKDFDVMILAVAKKNKYIGGNMHAFRSVGCFLSETEKEIPSETEGAPPETKFIYKFEGYLHKTI